MIRGVFSKHLMERRDWWLSYQKRSKSIDKDNELNYVCAHLDKYEHYAYVICQSKSASNHKIATYVTKCCLIPELSKVVNWISENIVYKAYKDTYQTAYVKIRIATDMLNKLVENETITFEDNIYFHDNLVSNVLDLKQDLLSEDLPFLIYEGLLCNTQVKYAQLPNLYPFDWVVV